MLYILYTWHIRLHCANSAARAKACCVIWTNGTWSTLGNAISWQRNFLPGIFGETRMRKREAGNVWMAANSENSGYRIGMQWSWEGVVACTRIQFIGLYNKICTKWLNHFHLNEAIRLKNINIISPYMYYWTECSAAAFDSFKFCLCHRKIFEIGKICNQKHWNLHEYFVIVCRNLHFVKL